jgi:hypothetical protein
VIHRFVDLLEAGPLDPIIVYMAFHASSDTRLWLAGGLATPFQLSTTQENTLNSPMISPTAEEIVYGVGVLAGGFSVRRVNMDDTGDTQLVAFTGTRQATFPYWSPDGAQIVYRTVDYSTTPDTWEIRVMDRDGTNDTLLHSVQDDLEALTCPAFSPSGDYICFGRGRASTTPDDLWVMDADGSNPQAVAQILDPIPANSLQWRTPYTHPSWQHNADVIGWCELDGTGAAFGGKSRWRKVNADGTGLTTLYEEAHTAGAPNVRWTGSGRFCWLPDDSGMVSMRATGSSNPRWELYRVNSDGSGIASVGGHMSYGTLTANPYGIQTGEQFRPAVFGDRIYWSPGDSGTVLINQDVKSVLADGSDLRTDDDGTTVSPNHGFNGYAGTTS